MIKFRSITIVGLLILVIGTSNAQTSNQMGAIPSFMFSQEINQAWGASMALSSQMLLTEDFVDGQEFPRKVRNINLLAVVSYDRSPKLKFDFGFLFRKMDPFDGGQAYELRPWQQGTFQFYLSKFRWRNRLRIEERIFTREDQKSQLDWRIRYRLSLDFPLSGERLDPGELYLNSSFEAHLRLDEEDVLSSWENRTYLGLGLLFQNRNRLEFGPEYRYRRRMEGINSRFIYWRMVWVGKLRFGSQKANSDE